MFHRVRVMTATVAIAGLLAGGAALYAQGPGSGGGRGPGRFGRGLGMEFQGLNLTEAQRQQIQAFTQQYRDQVFSILTPEQQQLVQQRRTEREARMKQRRERFQQRQQQQ